MDPGSAIRRQLAAILEWKDAHVDFDTAVAGIPVDLRGTRPPGLPYSAWELLEHLRITQHDILDFCRNPDYEEREWPADYWPASPAPSGEAEWDESIRRYRRDRQELQQMATDSAVDLVATIPHGNGQTCLRELLLVADHTSYHVGELVLVRRLLGIWR